MVSKETQKQWDAKLRPWTDLILHLGQADGSAKQDAGSVLPKDRVTPRTNLFICLSIPTPHPSSRVPWFLSVFGQSCIHSGPNWDRGSSCAQTEGLLILSFPHIPNPVLPLSLRECCSFSMKLSVCLLSVSSSSHALHPGMISNASCVRLFWNNVVMLRAMVAWISFPGLESDQGDLHEVQKAEAKQWPLPQKLVVAMSGHICRPAQWLPACARSPLSCVQLAFQLLTCQPTVVPSPALAVDPQRWTHWGTASQTPLQSPLCSLTWRLPIPGFSDFPQSSGFSSRGNTWSGLAADSSDPPALPSKVLFPQDVPHLRKV